MKLGEAVEQYIIRKRKDGFLYIARAGDLRQFAAFQGDIDLCELTTERVAAYLDSRKLSRKTLRCRNNCIGALVQYWNFMGEMQSIEMPPRVRVLRHISRSYVYTHEEIRGLLAASCSTPSNLNSTVAGQTMRALLLFLYATGASLGEGVNLKKVDVELRANVVRIGARGVHPPRSIPIGRDLSRALRKYQRDHAPKGGLNFFERVDGRRLNHDVVQRLFAKIRLHAGVGGVEGDAQAPRIYDLRATFAVHRITSWLKSGKDTNRLLPALSGYMGRQDLNSTAQYMELAPGRFKKELDKLSPMRGDDVNSSLVTALRLL